MTRALAALCLLLSCGAAGQVAAPTNQSQDEAAIRRVVSLFDEYWNQHKFSKTAELHTPDSMDVTVVGSRSTRAEIFQDHRPGFTKHSTKVRCTAP
jgi:hypothetical protein